MRQYLRKRRGRPRYCVPGFNVIGYVSGELGVAKTSQNFIRVLLEHGHPVAVYDMSPSRLGVRREAAYKRYTVGDVHDLPYAINFFTLPVRDAAQLLFSELADFIVRPGFFNVYLPIWELDVLPDLIVKSLSFCHLIVAYSDFVRMTMEKYFPKTPVISSGHPLYLPPASAMSRNFRLPKAQIIFIFSFEPRSDIFRKNPFAVIRAFKMAFKTSRRVALVIKINNPSDHPQIGTLKQACADDSRICLLTKKMSYADVLRLYSLCDAFVSLHRSEGLGLGPMEAMMLGKPVIATGWSGNVSYMNDRCACLVDYRLVPVKGDVKCYDAKYLGQTAYWAEPDIRDAARYMRRLANDPSFRRHIGKAAARSMALYQRKAKDGAFIEKILAYYRLWQKEGN